MESEIVSIFIERALFAINVFNQYHPKKANSISISSDMYRLLVENNSRLTISQVDEERFYGLNLFVEEFVDSDYIRVWRRK